MATRITTTTLDDGTLAVSKTALTGDRSDRMAEAKWLAEVRSPIVVRFLRVTDNPVVIQTEHGGQRTLRTSREDPPAVARLLVRLARGLAGIHDQGLVHGKITLDHIIIGAGTRPGGDNESIVLCSPSGVATDPIDDLRAVGMVISDLLTRWDAEDVTVANRAEWERIVERLAAADEATSAHRIGRWLAPLAVERPITPDVPEPDAQRPTRRGMLLVAVFVGLALIGRFIGPFGPSSETAVLDAEGDPVLIDGSWYRFDRAGAATGCATGAAYLDPDSNTVWLVDDAKDGALATPAAVVPGATELAFEIDEEGECGLWATGPAGRSQIERIGR